ncbi:MAG: RagB/SusD family nutrient uptake outer membrane protein [Tannerellaceae bacterium]|jgi:hypothetical protein|nr:RagB/SusD family nutrient uptake outer membrane protein [Tannerellaceae bacterium]
MKNKLFALYIVFAGLSTSFTSCELEEIGDPNNPSVSLVTQNPSKGQLQTLVTGLEYTSRAYLQTAANAQGTFGREVWYFNSNDGRNIQYWTGQRGLVNGLPDANFYGVGSLYTSPYTSIKQGNLLIDAVKSSNLLTENEKTAYTGFAKTIQAYQYLVVANAQYKNGIRVDVYDEFNPGPVVSYEDALQHIRNLLDESYDELQKSGATLPFKLSAGYASFHTPQGLGKVNRALASRVAIYQKDWQGALNLLPLSFFDLDGNLNAGPAHVYGTPPSESYNPFYYILGANLATLPVPHPLFVEEAIPGDKRIKDKIYERENPIINTVSDVPLSSKYQDKRWTSDTSPVVYLRNEELILIYAEASAQTGKTAEAVRAVNRIREAAEIGEYTGETSLEALTDEILLQRRYSLWFEPAGHRWVDLRRYDRLNEISTALDGGAVFPQLDKPLAEINWDEYINNK